MRYVNNGKSNHRKPQSKQWDSNKHTRKEDCIESLPRSVTKQNTVSATQCWRPYSGHWDWCKLYVNRHSVPHREQTTHSLLKDNVVNAVNSLLAKINLHYYCYYIYVYIYIYIYIQVHVILIVPRREQPPPARMMCREITSLPLKPYGTYKQCGKNLVS
jgi:hypothetical protein